MLIPPAANAVTQSGGDHLVFSPGFGRRSLCHINGVTPRRPKEKALPKILTESQLRLIGSKTKRPGSSTVPLNLDGARNAIVQLIFDETGKLLHRKVYTADSFTIKPPTAPPDPSVSTLSPQFPSFLRTLCLP